MSIAALNELGGDKGALRRDVEMDDGHALKPAMLPLTQKQSSNP